MKLRVALALFFFACGPTKDAAPPEDAQGQAPAASTPGATGETGGAGATGPTGDSGPTGPTGAPAKNAKCASTWGKALTAPYGRLDGTILAVILPGDESCPRPNGDHLILQVLANGEAYRMVVNVQSDFGDDRRVLFQEVSATFTGAAWSEGWHKNEPLDYVSALSLHSNDKGFVPLALAPLAEAIAARLTIDDRVSVYATTSGGDSAHKIHRVGSNKDGAIVLDPVGSPSYLVFRFLEQSF